MEQRGPGANATNREPVSAVIPVKDRPDELAAAVEALLDQTAPPAELIVVDQSSSGECRSRIEDLYRRRSGMVPELVYVHDPNVDGLTAARNEGLRRSGSPLVLYCDDDSLPAPDSVRLLQQALAARQELLAAGGIITSYRPPRRWLRGFLWVFYRGPFRDERQAVYWTWARHRVGQIIPTGKLNGGFMMFRKDALYMVGGFDERYRGACVGEDVEISQRMQRRWGPAALALIGGANLKHESLGGWKKGGRAIEFQIVGAHYLLAKNWSIRNAVRFAWMVCGILLLATGVAVRHRTVDPIRSAGAGLRSVLKGYEGCPFLKCDPRSSSDVQGPAGTASGA